jgi:hypothetical protein
MSALKTTRKVMSLRGDVDVTTQDEQMFEGLLRNT